MESFWQGFAHNGSGRRDWIFVDVTSRAMPSSVCPGGAVVRKTGAGSATFTAANVIPDFRVAAGQVAPPGVVEKMFQFSGTVFEDSPPQQGEPLIFP